MKTPKNDTLTKETMALNEDELDNVVGGIDIVARGTAPEIKPTTSNNMIVSSGDRFAFPDNDALSGTGNDQTILSTVPFMTQE